jgi:recombination protein RecT
MTEQQQDPGQDLARAIGDAQAQQGRATAVDLVESMAGQFARTLPKDFAVEKFVRDAITELRQTPELQMCTPDSLLGAFMTAARLGLEVGGLLGEFYLTPRSVKNRSTGQQEKQVVPIIGYKGLLELARRSGRVGAVGAELIREGDTFRRGYDSTRGGKFTQWEPLDYEDRREVIGVLAWAEVGTGVQDRFLPISAVMDRKARGAAGDRGPWATDRDAMIRKTGFRALVTELPQSTALALARQVDEQVQTYDQATGELTP